MDVLIFGPAVLFVILVVAVLGHWLFAMFTGAGCGWTDSSEETRDASRF